MTIIIGAYEITDINNYLQKNVLSTARINIIANRNTSTIRIESNDNIDFTTNNSIEQRFS